MVRVMYKSKRNNKKVAEAMAQALGVAAESIDQVKTAECDILFLGCAIFAGNVAPEMDSFAEKLDKEKVGKVVLFSASGIGTDQFGAFREKLAAKGILVEKEAFCCKGNAFLVVNMGKPGEQELKEAAKFAKRMALQA